MIPFIGWSVIPIGPLSFSVWGAFVASGIALAAHLTGRHLSKTSQISSDLVWGAVPWVIVSALVGARLMHVLFYEPSLYLNDPIQILFVHHGGLSSTGGIIGGVIALCVWVWRARLTKADILVFFDALAVSFFAGFAVGRLGCYAAHHHLTEPLAGPHLLGTLFPDGLWRIDLGLMEAVSCGVLFLVLTWLRRSVSGLTPPFFLGLTLLFYGSLRLILDLFRADNLRYAHLTPAQWIGTAMIGIGLISLAYCLKNHCQKDRAIVV